METVTASHFKTHFGSILNRASRVALRIERRGHAPSVLLSAEAYEALKRQAAMASNEEEGAFERLSEFAGRDRGPERSLPDDPRLKSILAKHTRHWGA